MPKFETVDAIRMTFGLLEPPKAETREEMEKLVDNLVKIRDAVTKVIADILPGVEVRWEVPSPGTAIIEDRGEKPAAIPQAVEVLPAKAGGTTPGYI